MFFLFFYLFRLKPAPFWPWFADSVRDDLHQNDILAKAPDALPWNHIVIRPAEQAKKAALSRHHDGNDLTGEDIKFHIAHIAQPAAVGDIHNFLALKVCDSFHLSPAFL